MAEVPVLDHHTDSWDVRLSQTGVILDYLSGTLDKYAASDPREALRWILFDNHKLTANMATWRFLVNFAPEKVRNPDVIGFLKGRALAAMKVLNTHLGDNFDRDAFVAAIDFEDHPDLAGDPEDITIFVSANRGTTSSGILQRNEQTGGLRLAFTFDPGDRDVVEMRAQLMRDGRAVSEVWLYRWTRG
jgi:glucan biosynthesis protein